MKKVIVLALGGIAALAVAAVVAIMLGTRAPGSRPSAGPEVPAPVPADAPPAVAGQPNLGPPPPPGGPPMISAPIDYGPQPPKPPKGSWEAVTPVARPSALGPLGVAIAGQLSELQPGLTECFSEESQARFGAQRISATPGAELDSAGGGTPVLMLEIESSGGQARIVDAPVETRGSASEGTIACAQHVLRGKAFAAPDAPPGSRYKLTFSLFQQ